MVQQEVCLAEVRGDNRRKGEKAVLVGIDCLATDERGAAGVDHDGVNHERDAAVVAQGAAKFAYEFFGEEHAGLDGGGAYIVEKRAHLPDDKRDRQGIDFLDTGGVLVDDAGQCTSGIASAGRDCLDVCLDTGAAHGLAAGNCQDFGIFVH